MSQVEILKLIRESKAGLTVKQLISMTGLSDGTIYKQTGELAKSTQLYERSVRLDIPKDQRPVCLYRVYVQPGKSGREFIRFIIPSQVHPGKHKKRGNHYEEIGL